MDGIGPVDIITSDMIGMAGALAEEMIDEARSEDMSLEKSDDGVLSKPISEGRDLIPVSQFNKNNKVLDLTDYRNWMLDFTRSIRPPFIEKWKRVALGHKEADAPLLTEREAQAYYAAYDLIVLDKDLDKRCNRLVDNIQRLKTVRSRVAMENAAERMERRWRR